ncbi:MAG: M48 family metallopeptidase [Muribaculaceae bacterium]|nr:M48 family metallopeptidase [Muribaculaceae bacterium]
MKATRLFCGLLLMAALGMPATATAQFNIGKAASAISKTAQAVTLSDEQMAAYVKQSVDWMDAHNPVLPEDDPYTQRLRKLTANVKDADGIPLNFKVYNVIDVNAFACPDGSVRVFSSLMDIMSDDELMGVIGHEIGHVIKRHSKKALRQQLLTDAALDAAGAADGRVATLTDSQLGAISQSLINAKYSQKQESEADECGYDFLVANGLNPWGMAMAFEKLSSSEGAASQSAIQKMFSSHPDTKKRIEKMSKRATKDGFVRPESK